MRLVLIALMLAAPAVAADDIGSPARGETLAREVCAACHAVARGEVSPDPEAAAFADIADLVSTHPPVALRVSQHDPSDDAQPQSSTARKADDLIAYILSLREN